MRGLTNLTSIVGGEIGLQDGVDVGFCAFIVDCMYSIYGAAFLQE